MSVLLKTIDGIESDCRTAAGITRQERQRDGRPAKGKSRAQRAKQVTCGGGSEGGDGT